jgi:hypothetical protein
MNLQIKLVRLALKAHALALLLTVLNPACPAAFAFEGLITATLTRGGDTSSLLYTADKNVLRIERTETDWPHAKNIVNLKSGAVTLVFPHNRSFVRLKSAASDASTSPGFPALPPGIGPKTPSALQPPPGIGPTNPPGASQLPKSRPFHSHPGGLPPGIGPQPGHNPGASQLPGIPQSREPRDSQPCR